MHSNKKYSVVIFICIFSLVFLIFENYRVGKIVSEKQKKISQAEEKIEDKYIPIKKFGYSDIINAFGNQEGIIITKFTQKKEGNTATVEVDVLGDISLVEKMLKNIESKENFQDIQNIKIEKCEDNNIITRLNMNFIKNK
jgi:hypothetical protein